MGAFKLTAPEPTEAKVQEAVLKYLEYDSRVAWAHRFNVGAMESEYMDKEGNINKSYVQFAFKGCSDILGQLKDGRFLAVECKSRKGRLSPAQRSFLEVVKKNNGVAIVAKSVSDVVEGLR